MEYPPAIDLFRNATRRNALQFILETMGDDEWYQTRDFIDGLNTSRESVSKELQHGKGPLIVFGIVDPKHDPMEDTPNIAFYRRADSPVIDALRDWDGYDLFDLLGTTGSQRLVTFFLTSASPSESYSINNIRQDTPISYDSATKYMERLVDAGLVVTEEGTRTTRYRVDRDSPIYQFLLELNNTLVDTYDSRVTQYASEPSSHR